MLEINKVDERGFSVKRDNEDEMLEPACFTVNARSTTVEFISSSPNYRKYFSADYKDMRINGVAPASADDAVFKLREFVNFKSGGGGGDLDAHINDHVVHITAAERQTWNDKQDAITPLTAFNRDFEDNPNNIKKNSGAASAGVLNTVARADHEHEHDSVLMQHVGDNAAHVSGTDRSFWDGKADLGDDGKLSLDQVPDALLGNVRYIGRWDASINIPRLEDGVESQHGWYYITDVAGSQFGFDFEVGDWVINSNGVWAKITSTTLVRSVAGKRGDVSLNKSDVGLDQVDNTSDLNKPISNLTQTALDGKLSLTGGTVSGSITAEKFVNPNYDADNILTAGGTAVKASDIGTTTHTGLANLDYATSGHTGFASENALNTHENNSVIHVTQAERNNWNGKVDTTTFNQHASDQNIHVSAAEKDTWDTSVQNIQIHAANADIHVTAQDKIKWDNKVDIETLEAHAEDTDIHVTQADRAAWDNKLALDPENNLYVPGAIKTGANDDNLLLSSSGKLFDANNISIDTSNFAKLNADENTFTGRIEVDTLTANDIVSRSIISIIEGSNVVTITADGDVVGGNWPGGSLSAVINSVVANLTTHAQDAVIHITASDRQTWNDKQDAITPLTAFNRSFETNIANILMDGVASLGGTNNIARSNHRHPSDASKADVNHTHSFETGNLRVGDSALAQNTTGYSCTAVGTNALSKQTNAAFNTIVGSSACPNAASANYMTGVGARVLEYVNSTGAYYATALGNDTLRNLQSGGLNTAVGSGAGYGLTTGSNNTYAGFRTAYANKTGSDNSIVGYYAMFTAANGYSNSLVGCYCGYGAATYYGNSALGHQASRFYGTSNATPTSTTNGVFIGVNAYQLSASSTNEIVIGYNAVGGGSNTITLGNSSISQLRCRVGSITTFSDERLKENIELANLEMCYNTVKSLPVFRFSWKDFTGCGQDKNVTGFIANEVEKVFPKAVTTSNAHFPVLDEHGNPKIKEVRKKEIIAGENGEDVEKEVIEFVEETFEMKDVKEITMTDAIPTLWGALQHVMDMLEKAENRILKLEARLKKYEAQ